MKKPNKDAPTCPYCSTHPAIKKGFRKGKLRVTQRYLCNSCGKYFTLQPPQQTSKTYNLKSILDSISSYNLGTPLRKQIIPKSTIHNWIKNINLPMNRLRNNITNNPIIKHRFTHHKQPFLYQYHSLKLNFAKKFPGLINYLKEINTRLPKQIFNNSERVSKISKQPLKQSKETPTTMARRGRGCPRRGAEQGFHEVKTAEAIDVVGVSSKEKQNYAVKLAKLAASITKDNKQRHNIIENFMLINDTATIATEIPIYLTKEETNQNNLTGHIDILQLRFHKIYILDYKPEPINKQQTINQLILYRKALSKRTNIKKHKFKLAFFNDKGYYEFS